MQMEEMMLLGFSPIEPEVAEYMKVRLLNLIEKHQQPYSIALPEDPEQVDEAKLMDSSLVPPFPSDAWPPLIWGWCEECAAGMRIPPDFCCATLLVVFASLIGRKRQIRPERNNSKWVVTPNLWGLIIGRSGLLKTPAMKQMLSGLDDLIQVTMEKYQRDLQAYELQKEHARVNKLPSPPPLTLKRYKTEDPTIEALGPILRDNPQGLLLFRDELPGWLKSMNKKGQENARAFYLETWNASSNFTSDRIGRGIIHIPFMCLSVFGGTQPGPIASYVSRMRLGDDNDDGFLQRFQVMVWPNSIPWKPYKGNLDEELERDIKRIYQFLDQMTFDEKGNPIILEFSDEAQQLFDEWQADIQPRIRSDEIPDYMASHLSKYPKLLPSIALILELVQGAIHQTHPQTVSVKSFLMAKRWCEYLEPHAWKVYNCDQVSLIENAKRLISKVQSGKLQDGFTVREVHHSKHWSGLADSAQVQKACDYAEGKTWLIKQQQAPTGGRNSDRYYLNPNSPNV
jgi:putative DNA primase/helicase